MPIPNADSAIIPTEKLVGYLLNLAHPVGGPKARWFLRQGFRVAAPDLLAKAILELVRSTDTFTAEPTAFGTKYVVQGLLNCPLGKKPVVVTVWLLGRESQIPRLITAYPS